MARFALLLLIVCLTACTAPPTAAPIANAARLAQAPGVAGAPLTSGSGRPEPVTLWQDASIFDLVRRLIGSAHSRVMVEMYELGRKDMTSALGAVRARGVAVRVITDPTGPLSWTAWQFYYRQGDNSICGGSPGTEYFALGAVKQLYFGFWVKFSSPFSFPPDPEVHAAYAFAQSGQIVLDMERSGDVYFVNELPGSGGTSIPSLRSPSWSLGGWHQVEMLFDYAGTVKTWVDGVLTINATGVHYPSDAGFSQIEISPTWGGCPSGAPAFDSWTWYGHVHVARP